MYGNYGRLQDLDILLQNNIEVKGSVLLLRTGKISFADLVSSHLALLCDSLHDLHFDNYILIIFRWIMLPQRGPVLFLFTRIPKTTTITRTRLSMGMWVYAHATYLAHQILVRLASVKFDIEC